MFSIAHKSLLAIALLGSVSSAALAGQTPFNLSCEHQDQSAESTLTRQAPSGAHRLSKHVLEVVTTKNRKKFVDKPPHDEGGLGGVHWRYCGFDRQAKAHLIEMTDNGLFSGKMLLEDTGALLHAGQSVVFAPNQKSYLAVEQQDGMDGALWSVYDNKGKALWKGYAGTIQKVDGADRVISTFDQPRWNKQGKLTAHFACSGSNVHGIVALATTSLGTWGWDGSSKC